MSPTIQLDRSAVVDGNDRLAETIASYDAIAHPGALQFGDVDMGPYLERFVHMLPRGRATVLDAGCGSGATASGSRHAGSTSLASTYRLAS